jgi:hypothetical protein
MQHGLTAQLKKECSRLNSSTSTEETEPELKLRKVHSSYKNTNVKILKLHALIQKVLSLHYLYLRCTKIVLAMTFYHLSFNSKN